MTPAVITLIPEMNGRACTVIVLTCRFSERGTAVGCPAQPLHETISIMETMDTVRARGDV